MIKRLGFVVLVMQVFLGCGAEGAGAGSEERSHDEDRQDFPLELGTGEATFEPLLESEPLYLILGFQGLQHVLGSVRAWDIPEERYEVSLELLRESDGALVSQPARTRVPLLAQDGGYIEITGLRAVVQDPEAIVGERARLRVEVVGPAEQVARASETLTVEWAPSD